MSLYILSLVAALVLAAAPRSLGERELSQHTAPWRVQLGSPSKDLGRNIALDSDGYIYVVGSTWGVIYACDWCGVGVDKEAGFVSMLNPEDGTTVWGHQIASSGEVAVMAVACYGSVAHVAGTVSGAFPNSGYSRQKDVFVIAFEQSTGAELWRYRSGSAENDNAKAIAVDSTGIYVCGETKGSFFSPSSGSTDTFILKLSPQGNLEWGTQLAERGNDNAISLDLDKRNEVALLTSKSQYDFFWLYFDKTTGAYRSEHQDGKMKSNTYEESMLSTNTAAAKYSISHKNDPYDVEVTKNTCRAGTALVTYGTSLIVSCESCDVGRVSPHDYGTVCNFCEDGSTSSDGITCHLCPAGHKSNFDSGKCTQCPNLQWSYPGSYKCSAYNWKIATTTEEISVVNFTSLFIYLVVIGLVYVLDLSIGGSLVLLLSALNVLSDQAYTILSTYSQAIFMYLTLLLMLCTVVPYIYHVLRICGPNRRCRPRVLLKSPLLQAPFLRISSRDGAPLWGEDTTTIWDGSCSPFNLIGAWVYVILKQCVYSFGWVIFHFFYFAPWYIIHTIFYSIFFVLGYYLFHFKLLFVPKVEAWWLEWIVGEGPLSLATKAFNNASTEINRPAVNTAFLCEIFVESFPQFVIQLVNTLYTPPREKIALIAVVSLSFSLLSLVVHTFRISYWHVWRHVVLKQIPVWDASEEEIAPYLVNRESDETEGMLNDRNVAGDSDRSSGSSDSGDKIQNSKSTSAEENPLLLELIEENRRLLAEREELKQKMAKLEYVAVQKHEVEGESGERAEKLQTGISIAGEKSNCNEYEGNILTTNTDIMKADIAFEQVEI